MCVLGAFVISTVLGELAGSSVPHFVISVTEAGEGPWVWRQGQSGFATLEEPGLGGPLWEHWIGSGAGLPETEAKQPLSMALLPKESVTLPGYQEPT